MKLDEKSFKKFSKRLKKYFYKEYHKDSWYIETLYYVSVSNEATSGHDNIGIRFGWIDVEEINYFDKEFQLEWIDSYSIDVNVGMALNVIRQKEMED